MVVKQGLKRFRRFLANQVAIQLSEEIPSAFVKKVKLDLDIPVPLAYEDPNRHVPIFIERHASAWLGGGTALDIGCGANPRNQFGASKIYGCDIRGSEEGSVVGVDLFHDPIPFPDEFFDYVTAYDFIEHIPRVLTSRQGKTRFPFIEMMNEIHRVLKPGGLFFSQTPAYPSKQAFQDPTHVNIITEDTFPFYFCESNCNDGSLYAKAYGFKGSFSLVTQEWCYCWLLSLLKK